MECSATAGRSKTPVSARAIAHRVPLELSPSQDADLMEQPVAPMLSPYIRLDPVLQIRETQPTQRTVAFPWGPATEIHRPSSMHLDRPCSVRPLHRLPLQLETRFQLIQ